MKSGSQNMLFPLTVKNNPAYSTQDECCPAQAQIQFYPRSASVCTLWKYFKVNCRISSTSCEHGSLSSYMYRNINSVSKISTNEINKSYIEIYYKILLEYFFNFMNYTMRALEINTLSLSFPYIKKMSVNCSIAHL